MNRTPHILSLRQTTQSIARGIGSTSEALAILTEKRLASTATEHAAIRRGATQWLRENGHMALATAAYENARLSGDNYYFTPAYVFADVTNRKAEQ